MTAVDHPPHYTQHPSGVEAVDICEQLSFNLGNALKYVWRAGIKDPEKREEDLRKAAWYLDREVERFHTFDDDDDPVSLLGGDQWRSFARKVIFHDTGMLKLFMKRLLTVGHLDVLDPLVALREIVQDELNNFDEDRAPP